MHHKEARGRLESGAPATVEDWDTRRHFDSDQNRTEAEHSCRGRSAEQSLHGAHRPSHSRQLHGNEEDCFLP